MKNFRTAKFRLTSTAVVSVLAMAACADAEGGDGDDGGGGDGGGDGAGEESEEPSFAGETIDFYIPANPGGGFDTYSRLVAPYLEEELDASLALINEGGGGGVIASNLVAASDPESPAIGINQMGAMGITVALGDDEGIDFDLTELSFFANIASAEFALVASTDAPYDTLEEMQNYDGEITWVAPSPVTTTYFARLFVAEVFDVGGEIVTGFDGVSETLLSIISGDTDVTLVPFSTALPEIEDGNLKVITILDYEPPESGSEYPTVFDEDLSSEQEQLLDEFVGLLALTRTFYGPPSMPEPLVEELRQAMANVLENPDFLAEAEEANRPISLTEGSDVAERISMVADPSEKFLEVLQSGE